MHFAVVCLITLTPSSFPSFAKIHIFTMLFTLMHFHFFPLLYIFIVMHLQVFTLDELFISHLEHLSLCLHISSFFFSPSLINSASFYSLHAKLYKASSPFSSFFYLSIFLTCLMSSQVCLQMLFF